QVGFRRRGPLAPAGTRCPGFPSGAGHTAGCWAGGAETRGSGGVPPARGGVSRHRACGGNPRTATAQEALPMAVQGLNNRAGRAAMATTTLGFMVGLAFLNAGSAHSIGGLCNGRPASHTWLDASGQPGPALLDGTGKDDTIVGSDGDDTIDGRAGNDVICGGPGHDSISGGSGGDALRGDTGDDSL